MTRIFNGQDLSGWDGDPRLWSVKDGAIHGETTAENPAKGNTFLIWQDGVTKDFELRLSFRCNATNNSGIQYRSKHITEGRVSNKWVVRGYQHEIRDEVKLPSVTGFIYDEGGRRGRICLVGEKATWGADGKKKVTERLIDQDEFQKLFKLDDWNDVVIIAKGNHIQHYLNNVLILDFTDDDPQLTLLDGILALQLHAGAPMWAEFKDIRIKESSRDRPVSSGAEDLCERRWQESGADGQVEDCDPVPDVVGLEIAGTKGHPEGMRQDRPCPFVACGRPRVGIQGHRRGCQPWAVELNRVAVHQTAQLQILRLRVKRGCSQRVPQLVSRREPTRISQCPAFAIRWLEQGIGSLRVFELQLVRRPSRVSLECGWRCCPSARRRPAGRHGRRNCCQPGFLLCRR